MQHADHGFFRELSEVLLDMKLNSMDAPIETDLEEAYNLFSESYDTSIGTNFNERMLETIDGLAGKKILDVGCGTGSLSRLLAEAGGEVTGVDLSERMIDIAIEKTQEDLGIAFVKADVRKTSFTRNQFDIIMCKWVLSHYRRLDSFFTELDRVLKDDGLIVISTLRGTLHPGGLVFVHNNKEYLIRAEQHDLRYLLNLAKRYGWRAIGIDLSVPALTTIRLRKGAEKDGAH